MSIKKNRLLEISKVKEFTTLDVKISGIGPIFMWCLHSLPHHLHFFSLHNDQGCKCDILCKVGVVRIEEEWF